MANLVSIDAQAAPLPNPCGAAPAPIFDTKRGAAGPTVPATGTIGVPMDRGASGDVYEGSSAGVHGHDGALKCAISESLGVDALSPPLPKVTSVPQLLTDWRSSVVVASVREFAVASFQPELDAAIEAAVLAVGRPLSRRESRMVTSPVMKVRLPEAVQSFQKMMAQTAAQRQLTVKDAIVRHRYRVSQLKDPFTPLASGDPAARKGEAVLWENERLMVIVDKFSASPKLLVVPKQSVAFPVDASPELLVELADVAARAADALLHGQKAQGPAEIWVNPPQYLAVAQMHVHVQPHLPLWASHRLDKEALPRLQEQVFEAVEERLVTALGPADR